MKSIFEQWITRDVGEVFVQHFDAALSSFFGIKPVCVHAPECGRALALEFNGDVYSCDHYVESGYLLGNITVGDTFKEMLNTSFQRKFAENKRAELPAQCRNCLVLRQCWGRCPKDRFVYLQDEAYPLNYLCSGYKDFFTHIRPDLVAMARIVRAGGEDSLIMQPRIRANLRSSAAL